LDPRVLSILSILEAVSLCVIAGIAVPTICGWLLPGLDQYLPHGWSRMRANTALLVLLSALSILLTRHPQPGLANSASRILGFLVFGIAIYTLAEFHYPSLWRIDTLIGGDSTPIEYSRPSEQACFGFMLIGAALSNIRARRRPFGSLVDACTLLLGLFFFSYVGSMVLERKEDAGHTLWYHLAPQSFLCFGLITFLVFHRRSRYGIFSVLLESGIGGKMARIATPFAIVLPFLIDTSQIAIRHFHLLPESYAIAIVPSTVAILAFLLVLVLAKRSAQLEDVVRELSLRDELTHLYNRRGFFALAEQSLRHTVRDGFPFSVLFIDVDNLKTTNDALGHDVGSELLKDIARLLESSFRESDVIGRVGGDEFVVALRADEAKLANAVQRLEQATMEKNEAPGRRYEIRFSLGHVTRSNPSDSLEHLIERADNLMYQAKRKKRLQRQDEMSLVSGG
jgi:diguanylate cyclase (GGDEF)-like protein